MNAVLAAQPVGQVQPPRHRDARRRDAGLDIACAISIYLVIVNHVDLFFAGGITILLDQHPILTDFINVLNFFRIPLFFFVSGILSAELLHQNARAALVERVLPLTDVPQLWTVLHFLVAGRHFDRPHAVITDEASLLFHSVTHGEDSAWFLIALAMYSAAFLLLRRLPAWAQLAIGAALFVLPVTLLRERVNHTRFKVLANFIVFTAGIRLASSLPVWRPYLARWVAVALSLAGLLATLLVMRLFDLTQVAPVRAIATGFRIVLGLSFEFQASRLPGGGIAAFLGRHTLEIYLIHTVILVVLRATFEEPGGLLPWWTAFPVAALTMAVSVGAGLVLNRVPFLFRAPWLKQPRMRHRTEAAQG